MLTLNAIGRHGGDLIKFLKSSLKDEETELKILIDGPIQVEELRRFLEPLGFANFVIEDDDGILYIMTSKKTNPLADKSTLSPLSGGASVAESPSPTLSRENETEVFSRNAESSLQLNAIQAFNPTRQAAEAISSPKLSNNAESSLQLNAIQAFNPTRRAAEAISNPKLSNTAPSLPHPPGEQARPPRASGAAAPVQAKIKLQNSTGVLISCENKKYKKIFMRKILSSLVNSKIKPEVLALMNDAVSLAVYNSDSCDYLKELESNGVKILVSESCADYLGVTEALGAGTAVDMSEIFEEIFSCERILNF